MVWKCEVRSLKFEDTSRFPYCFDCMVFCKNLCMNTSQYPHVLHVVEIILHGTFVTGRGSSASSDHTTNQIEDTVRKDQYGKASKNRKQNQNDLMS